MATFILSKKPLNHKRSIWGLTLQCFGGSYLGNTRAFMSATITVICILWLHLGIVRPERAWLHKDGDTEAQGGAWLAWSRPVPQSQV